ncbi:MAG: hypothetical protein K2H46_06880 [Muribaculaceae bacterium]|nr:hypothetical protein [Muribaculaceae bacterium]
MDTSAYIDSATENYWKLLSNIDDEIKLNLIEKLTHSLRKSFRAEKYRKDPTAEFIAKFNGAWKTDESPEEIITIINQNKSIGNVKHFDRLEGIRLENWIHR